MPIPSVSPRAVRRAAFVALAVLVLAAGPAAAHGVGMSQIQLRIDGTRIEGKWDLNLRDARLALGLDPQLAGEAGWRDLRGHEPALRALLARSLALASDGRACPVEVTAAPIGWDAQYSTVRLHLGSTCPSAPRRLGMRCDLLFDLDPGHRAYFSVEDARVTSVGVFRAGLRAVTIDVHQFHFWEVVAEFIRDGVGHIWTGPDHMLFLVALLLPAALVGKRGDWTPRVGLWATAREVAKVVTAFTVAHSLTLALAFFGAVRIPSQWVEVGIAFSVFAAAWNNLRPFLPGRAWVMALAFGLVHGLGFAGTLSNLSLPRNASGLALAAFNIGVELGQLAIVAGVLPLLHAGSRRRWYPRLVMGVGSLAIAWLAVIWIIERAFNLSLFARR
jgi:hypothetical protein